MEWFDGMEGLTLDGLRAVSRFGRWAGHLEVWGLDGRWVLLFRPSGKQERQTFYLQGEKSGRPREFARLDTVMRIARRLGGCGLWVSYNDVRSRIPRESASLGSVDL